MVRPEKWADFAMVGTVSKHWAGRAIPYVQFQCPYECGFTVDLPEANVKNNKSNRCHDHLMTCTGITADGKRAEDDPRVSNERKGAAQCSARPAKRGRSGEAATTAIDTTLALREEVAALQASKDALASRNDGLQGRVLDLEAQMEEMRVRDRQRDDRDRRRDLEMHELRAEMHQLRPLVPLVQRITSELGLSATSVPPAAPIDTYVARIGGLKKAAASAHAPPNDKRIAKLKREIETLQRQNQQLLKAGIEGQKYVDYWRLANPLFHNPKDSVMFLRKAMVFVHPDKQPDHKASANALQQILNHLVHELRTA